MSIMINELLPIGSVVRLKGIKKLVMIFGFLQKSGISNVRTVDYIGVPYPEGNIGMYAQIGFHRTDIEEVIFEGYRTKELERYNQIFVAEKYTDTLG